MIINDLPVIFHPNQALKHYRKGKLIEKFEYRVYNGNMLCVISCLKKKFNRREKKDRMSDKEFITTLRKPYKGASIDTTPTQMKDFEN